LFVVLNQDHAEDAGSGAARLAGDAGERGNRVSPECIEIGLVNNMPDAALRATERQFIDLLSAAAGDRVVRLHFFALAEIPRGDAEGARLRAAYAGTGELATIRLDGLIVTGCEPRAERLTDEPYWNSLADVVDWAEHNTVSTIWSCLAAHAAVLHLDGIDRRRLAKKRSGVFDCHAVADDPLLADVRTLLPVSHSRWNDLPERELTAHGYRVLTRSPVAGVDIFTKRWQSLFVFFQGHPEYSADTLMREYRRDVGRYLRGESAGYPAPPVGYFDRRMETELAAFAAAAVADRDPGRLDRFPVDAVLRASLVRRELRSGVPLMANWLSYLASRKE
jgi:homoserine O-succinyltransferase/O-acetyltransferase